MSQSPEFGERIENSLSQDNPYASPASTTGLDSVGERPGKSRSEERLARLLLRLLGVFFAADGLIGLVHYGLEILFVLRVFPGDPFEVLISACGLSLARFVGSVAALAIGVYLVSSGEWVLGKVLAPAIGPLSSPPVPDQVQKAPADPQNPRDDDGGAAGSA